jgi:hypothetical protein
MWISNPSELFSSYKLIPTEGDDPSETFNALTRLLLLSSLVIWWKYPEILEKFLLYGTIAILMMYIIMKDNQTNHQQKKKEKFSPLSYKMEHPTPNSKTLTAIKNLKPESDPVVPQNPPISPPAASPLVSVQIPVSQSNGSVLPSLLNHNPVEVTPISQPQYPSTQTVYVAKELIPDEATPISSFQNNKFPSEKLVKPFTVTAPVQKDEGMRPPQKFFTPNMGVNAKMYQAPILAPRMMDSDFSDIESNQPVNFNPLQDMGMHDERTYYSTPQRKRNNTSMLIDKTDDSEVSECVPTSKFFEGSNKFFMQDIQPNLYTFNYDPTPINSSIGISYTPQIPPLQKMKMCTPNGQRMDVFTRIDPQLIREDVPPQRKEELPSRGPWSSKQSQLEATSSMDGVTSIYDPRFTGYGDEYRSYQDINLGNVKYYYTDVDAYRSPNFVVRNKVDHVDMQQPMGNTYSSYPREAALEDVRDIVNDDWMAKSIQHREDLMERQMQKMNARSWQTKFAPVNGGARLSTFTSSY